MPIYDYHCADCDDVFEKLVMAPVQSPRVCPRCGSRKIERVFSAPALHHTASRDAVLKREYQSYRKQWKDSAYMPKSKPKRSVPDNR
jgi:putative FmdB family regulatory protein